jgi:hypothetical protein
MDKKIAGLLGAAAALTTMTAANAAAPSTSAQTESLQASSYADLLAPVPNALAQLIADDTARATKSSSGQVDMAQIRVEVGRHDHHHHHRYRRHRHHHHHHHSNFMAIPRATV